MQYMPNDPAFKAMEADIDKRHARRVEQRQTAYRKREEGNAAFKAGQYAEALAIYEAGLEADKRSIELHGNAAMAALKSERRFVRPSNTATRRANCRVFASSGPRTAGCQVPATARHRGLRPRPPQGRGERPQTRARARSRECRGGEASGVRRGGVRGGEEEKEVERGVRLRRGRRGRRRRRRSRVRARCAASRHPNRPPRPPTASVSAAEYARLEALLETHEACRVYARARAPRLGRAPSPPWSTPSTTARRAPRARPPHARSAPRVSPRRTARPSPRPARSRGGGVHVRGEPRTTGGRDGEAATAGFSCTRVRRPRRRRRISSALAAGRTPGGALDRRALHARRAFYRFRRGGCWHAAIATRDFAPRTRCPSSAAALEPETRCGASFVRRGRRVAGHRSRSRRRRVTMRDFRVGGTRVVDARKPMRRRGGQRGVGGGSASDARPRGVAPRARRATPRAPTPGSRPRWASSSASNFERLAGTRTSSGATSTRSRSSRRASSRR